MTELSFFLSVIMLPLKSLYLQHKTTFIFKLFFSFQVDKSLLSTDSYRPQALGEAGDNIPPNRIPVSSAEVPRMQLTDSSMAVNGDSDTPVCNFLDLWHTSLFT